MTTSTTFRCAVCQGPTGNTHLSLDRRIEKVTMKQHDGKPVTAINIAQRETLSLYCSHACWDAQQPEIAAALQLQRTYPAFSFVTPCCRCGKAVNRTQRYVCYSITEMSIEGEEVLIGHVVDEHDYAVLCRDCEDPDQLEDAIQMNEIEEVTA